MKNKVNKSTTLRGIIRLKITEAYDGNKFWLINNHKQLYIKDDLKNGMISNDQIVQGIVNGSIKTDWQIKNHEIFVDESEFFRIVEHLNSDGCVPDGRGYQFIKDIIEIKVGRSHKRYDPWFDQESAALDDLGVIYVNGKRFKKIFCSSSHNRAKKALFVSEGLYDKVMEINLCGIDSHNPQKLNYPCKWEAYEGMTCTDSQAVSMPNIVVVRDFSNPIKDNFDVISGKVVKNKKGKSIYEISTDVKTEKNKKIKILPFDGAGLVSITFAQKWTEELGLDYIPSSFQFRVIPGVKGNLYPFDILKFAETYHVRKIKDCWNKEWDLYDDKIDCIMTESQFKFKKLYDSFKEWKGAFDNKTYGYERTFNISDPCIPYDKLKRHCIMSYQPLQSLELTDDEIKLLCEDTVDKVKKVHSDIETFCRWRGLDEESEKEQGSRSYTNPALKALQYNHSLATDPYVHTLMLNELRNFRRANHIKIRVEGNYQVLIPDVFGLAQWAFGIQPTGLLGEKQVYNKFWSDRHVKELDLVRFPHIAREHCLATVANGSSNKWSEMQKWYKYQNVGYITSMWDSFALRMGTADYDNDHIYGVANKTLVEAVRRQEANTIYFAGDDDAEKQNQKVMPDDYCAMAASDSIGMGNDIGTVVNATSKLWSMITPDNTPEQNKKIMDYIKVLSVVDSLTIDFVKSGIKADVPLNIKAQLKGYKNPYFFQFRSTKEYNAEKAAKRNSDVYQEESKALHSDSLSTMNRVAHYMDSQIAPLQAKYDVPVFEYTTLLQGDNDLQESVIYKRIKKKLLKLNEEFQSFCGDVFDEDNLNMDCDKKDSIHANYVRLNLFFADCKNQLLTIQPDTNKLINDVVICFYFDKAFEKIQNRAILWNCFSSQMIARVQNRKSNGKIYDINALKKQHQKLIEKQKKAKKINDGRISIPFIDNIGTKVSITDADKKYVNRTLKTQRSKKLYYAFLYIRLKMKSAGNEVKCISVGNSRKEGQISQFQIQKLSGIENNDWSDAIASLKYHHMIKVNLDNSLVPKIEVLYTRLNGKEIELSKTCKGMRHWINHYVPSKPSESAEFYKCSNYKSNGRERTYNRKAVIRLEDKKVFKSARDAHRETGASYNVISFVCQHKKAHYTAGGYHWMYLSEYEQDQNKKDA